MRGVAAAAAQWIQGFNPHNEGLAASAALHESAEAACLHERYGGGCCSCDESDVAGGAQLCQQPWVAHSDLILVVLNVVRLVFTLHILVCLPEGTDDSSTQQPGSWLMGSESPQPALHRLPQQQRPACLLVGQALHVI